MCEPITLRRGLWVIICQSFQLKEVIFQNYTHPHKCGHILKFSTEITDIKLCAFPKIASAEHCRSVKFDWKEIDRCIADAIVGREADISSRILGSPYYTLYALGFL
jgi:hypothetical protein